MLCCAGASLVFRCLWSSKPPVRLHHLDACAAVSAFLGQRVRAASRVNLNSNCLLYNQAFEF